MTITSTEIPVTLGQAVVPTTTDVSSLTTQATQAVVSEAKYTPAQEALSRIQTPYPTQTPSQMLKRQYKVYDFDFVPASTAFAVSFPSTLFAQPVIAAAMMSFKFWRADIKVHIKMQSVPQQRGAVLASWKPCTALPPANKIQASGNHATILNISTSDTATFVIPYLSPKAWLTYPEYTASDHSTLFITTLVPLSAPTGISNVVKFTVYASFENPEVAGFVHTDAAQSGIQPIQKVLATVNPIVNSLMDLTTVIQPALGLLNLLDKPEVSTQAQYMVTGGMRATDWLTDAQVVSIPMSLKERPYLTNTVNLFPLGKSSDSFASLAANPMLCFQKEVTAAADRIEYPVNPCVPSWDGVNWGPDYLFHFTRYAQYWRGGIRFFMHFCCDQFTSSRFRVGISYKAWNATWADSGDVPSAVVDVHGSTYYAVTVPYLHDEYWQKVVIPFTAGSSFFPRLYIEALDTPVGATAPASPKITISLFRAAAPDFQLAEPGYTEAETPVRRSEKAPKKRIPDKAQCSLEGAFSKSFASLVPGSMLTFEQGLCMPEVMDSPAQLCKRTCIPLVTSVNCNGLDTPYSMPHYYLNLTAEVFAFWRGSRRCQYTRQPDTSLADLTTGVITANPISPKIYEWGEADPQGVGVTLPYYSPLPYRVMGNYNYTGRPFTASVTWFCTTSPTSLEFRYSAGDDLVCGHLVAPTYDVDAPS